MNVWNSTLKRKTPLQRTKALAHKAAIKAGKKKLRSRGPKMTPIRASAKDENCTLRFSGICKNRTDTTVWCHSNSSVDGKGMGLKARDEEGCYGCFECHSYLDGGWVQDMDKGVTREYVDGVFYRAREESQAILRQKKLMAEAE